MTSKAIMYMADCSTSLENQGDTIVSVAPKGIPNLVLDVHRYEPSDPTSDFQTWQADSVTAGCVAMFVGEWGENASGGAISPSAYQPIINTYAAAFKKLGLGEAYWAWWNGDPNTDEIMLVNSATDTPSWIATLIANAISGITSTTSTSSASTNHASATTATSAATRSTITVTSTIIKTSNFNMKFIETFDVIAVAVLVVVVMVAMLATPRGRRRW
jgi:hypothetical protein